MPEQLARMIGDLDGDRFSVREKARHELEALGELAEPALRRAVEASPSLEMRRRAEGLLGLIERHSPAPDKLRELRALEALERAGTSEARLALRALAGGAPGGRLTKEAKAALARLKRQRASQH
jgi:hypothetical protein